RAPLLDKLAQSDRVAIGRVFLEKVVLDRVDLFELLACQFAGGADYGGFYGLAELPPDLLGGSNRLGAPLSGDDQDAHRLRASNFSFSTSFLAASCGGPSKICA